MNWRAITKERQASTHKEKEGGGETDGLSDNRTQKRGWYKVDCSDNVAAALRRQKPVKKPKPKSPTAVLSYPSWWSFFHKTSSSPRLYRAHESLTRILA